jgi:hypothetical protein
MKMGLIEFIQKGLSESDSSPSTMRILSFYVVVLFATALTFGFCWAVIFFGKDTAYVLGFAGILYTGITTVMSFKKRQKALEIESELKEPEKTITE